MLKRFLIFAVSLCCASLLLSAAASANHDPWDPPAWWTEVISGGTPAPPQFESEDCTLRGPEGGGWRQYCWRRYPGGTMKCGGSVGHLQSTGAPFRRFGCVRTRAAPGEDCGRNDWSPYERGDTGWATDWTNPPPDPAPGCFERIKNGSSGGDAGGGGGGGEGGGHDLVSLCGTARFAWYRGSFGDPDVEKGEEACIHTVSNDVAQQLAADGLRKAPEVFGNKLVDWAKGQLVPDPDDVIQQAMPAWDRAFRAAGRANVITRIGEATGLAGVAIGYTFAASHVANKNACLMFITSTSANLGVDGSGGGTSFEVDGWQMVYNRKYVVHPKRDAYLHTADVSQKDPQRFRSDKWENRMTSMRCGKGGKVFLTKRHDEKKIVSNRVRAAG